jgi:hypothetical protein
MRLTKKEYKRLKKYVGRKSRIDAAVSLPSSNRWAQAPIGRRWFSCS